MNIQLSLLAGIDIPIPELSISLHPPTLKEIAFMGEIEFFSAVQTLSIKKELITEDKSLLDNLSNFQILMKVLQEVKEKKQEVLTLLSLLFPSSKIIITPNSILIDDAMLDKDNFDNFQNLIAEVFCMSSIFQGDNVTYNPGNEAARRIRDKLMRGRKRIAEIKSKGNESVIMRYVSIISVGLHFTFDECFAMNLFQLFDIVERYNLYIAQDSEFRIRLAGGDPKEDVENWMKNIHK